MFDYEIKSSVSWRERIGLILGIVAFLLLGRIFVYQFSNPHLTQTQVFIDMWLYFFAAILAGLIGGIIYRHESE